MGLQVLFILLDINREIEFSIWLWYNQKAYQSHEEKTDGQFYYRPTRAQTPNLAFRCSHCFHRTTRNCNVFIKHPMDFSIIGDPVSAFASHCSHRQSRKQNDLFCNRKLADRLRRERVFSQGEHDLVYDCSVLQSVVTCILHRNSV